MDAKTKNLVSAQKQSEPDEKFVFFFGMKHALLNRFT
jgi:hypothetical protein